MTSYCLYKGSAVHFEPAVETDGPAIAWSCRVPKSGMEPIAGLIAFYQDRVKVVVEEPG